MLTYSEGSYSHITNNLSGITTVFTGVGTLERVVVNSYVGATGGTITLQDSPSIGTIAILASPYVGDYTFNVACRAGLVIVCTNSPDLTIVYRH